jgi:predicted DNA-binding transcriptional regulator YafY
MSDPAARLLALLSLLQTPREWPSSELAQRFGVTDRTVRRDVERLRGLGTHADTVPWLASRILHLGCEFDVCGPPELSEYLRGLTDRIMRAIPK